MNRFLGALVFLVTCSLSSIAQKVTITNPSSIDRKAIIASILWLTVLKVNPAIDEKNLQVLGSDGKILPHQLEYLGQQKVQNLLVQINVEANGQTAMTLRSGKTPPTEIKTYARYVPERKEDFAWENDKIGFRMYGKALEQTNENAHGIDVWVKRTSRMVINDRYQKNDYHTDHGDGLDYYSVGNTLGAGDMAPFMRDSVWYLGNYSQYTVLDNGPLRSTFRLDYEEREVNGLSIKVSKLISIDAGSQLNKHVYTYTFNKVSELPVAVGLATRQESVKKTHADEQGIMAYWEPVHGENGMTGVGALLLKKPVKRIQQEKQLIGSLTVQSGVPVVYYAGAAWNKAGEIVDFDQWLAYLSLQNEQIRKPLSITVK